MSAFVVSREHIRFLMEAALVVVEMGEQIGRRFWIDGQTLRPDGEARTARDITATEAGQRLWDENIRSVVTRYPDCGTPEGGFIAEELPGPTGETYKYKHERVKGLRPTPAQVFRAIDCLDYQSCETEDWQHTWAFRFLAALRVLWCDEVPGAEGMPWEITSIEVYGQTVRVK